MKNDDNIELSTSYDPSIMLLLATAFFAILLFITTLIVE